MFFILCVLTIPSKVSVVLITKMFWMDGFGGMVLEGWNQLSQTLIRMSNHIIQANRWLEYLYSYFFRSNISALQMLPDGYQGLDASLFIFSNSEIRKLKHRSKILVSEHRELLDLRLSDLVPESTLYQVKHQSTA